MNTKDNKDINSLNESNGLNKFNNLCMGCMRPRGVSEQCPVCGWVDGTQPDSPLYLPPRTELNNRYVIGRVLGHGGFGITYLAWDQELYLKVAIKEYFPEGLGTRAHNEKTVSVYSGHYGQDFEYGLEKFLVEARTLARFQNNPNIVSIFNYFKENGTAYLVMEYVEGISLKQYLQIKKDGRIPLDEALTYIMPVADALIIVHAAGMLHRDISPDNIYITSDYHVKLLDFGASRKAVSEVNKSLSVLLKPGYAPIEQYSSRGVQGQWTDVYALAATLYRLLSGQTPPESIDRMQGLELEDLTTIGIDLPEGVEAVLRKALAIQPLDRYQSIEEFKAVLDKVLSLDSSKSLAKQTADNSFTAENETLRGKQQETVVDKQVLIGIDRLEVIEPVSELIEIESKGVNESKYKPSLVSLNTAKRKWTWLGIAVIALLMLIPLGFTIHKYTTASKPPPVKSTEDSSNYDTGTLTYPDGAVYDGQIIDGKANGQGTKTQADGAKYVGGFKDDTLNGQGNITLANGNTYMGDFEDDRYNGRGTYTWTSGAKYVGEFKDGKRNGQGNFTMSNGDTYIGEFKDDTLNGQGTYTWTDGRKYIGDWLDAKPNGQGTKTWPDGTIQIGLWKDGKFIGSQ